MTADDVGRFRYCPACAAPIGPAILASEDPDSDTFQAENARCSRCERPWTACPCLPEPGLSGSEAKELAHRAWDAGGCACSWDEGLRGAQPGPETFEDFWSEQDGDHE